MFTEDEVKTYTISSKVLFDRRLKSIDIKVYIIAHSTEDDNRTAFPSVGWFSNKLSTSQCTVERSLARLRGLGYIKRKSAF